MHDYFCGIFASEKKLFGFLLQRLFEKGKAMKKAFCDFGGFGHFSKDAITLVARYQERPSNGASPPDESVEAGMLSFFSCSSNHLFRWLRLVGFQPLFTLAFPAALNHSGSKEFAERGSDGSSVRWLKIGLTENARARIFISLSALAPFLCAFEE